MPTGMAVSYHEDCIVDDDRNSLLASGSSGYRSYIGYDNSGKQWTNPVELPLHQIVTIIGNMGGGYYLNYYKYNKWNVDPDNWNILGGVSTLELDKGTYSFTFKEAGSVKIKFRTYADASQNIICSKETCPADKYYIEGNKCMVRDYPNYCAGHCIAQGVCTGDCSCQDSYEIRTAKTCNAGETVICTAAEQSCVIPMPAAPAAECTDTDSGINYYKKGSTKKEVLGGIGSQYGDDFCKKEYIPEDVKGLREFYCNQSNDVVFIDYNCPDGCQDGACLGNYQKCGDGFCNINESIILKLGEPTVVAGITFFLKEIIPAGQKSSVGESYSVDLVVVEGPFTYDRLESWTIYPNPEKRNIKGISIYLEEINVDGGTAKLKFEETAESCPVDCAEKPASTCGNGICDSKGRTFTMDLDNNYQADVGDLRITFVGYIGNPIAAEIAINSISSPGPGYGTTFDVGGSYGNIVYGGKEISVIIPNGAGQGINLTIKETAESCPADCAQQPASLGKCAEGDADKEYTCPDGSNILWCKCFGEKWTCIDNPVQYCAGYKPTAEQPVQSQACDGCMVNGRCVRVGQRVTGNYCALEGNMTSQKEKQIPCDENYECVSNTCVGGKCVDQYGLIVKTWCYLKCAGVVAKEFLTFGPQAGTFFEPCVLSCLEKY